MYSSGSDQPYPVKLGWLTTSPAEVDKAAERCFSSHTLMANDLPGICIAQLASTRCATGLAYLFS